MCKNCFSCVCPYISADGQLIHLVIIEIFPCQSDTVHDYYNNDFFFFKHCDLADIKINVKLISSCLWSLIFLWFCVA